MRTLPTVCFATALSLFAGAALAQTTAPVVPAPKAPAATAPMGGMDKKAMSKECSTKADAQGLHGKARKKFRSACKAGKA